MYPSSTMCRSQQAFHRARAETSQLENVRLIAGKAAAAWGVEAAAAEDREARRERVRLTADIIDAQKQHRIDESHACPSENPDRNHPRV